MDRRGPEAADEVEWVDLGELSAFPNSADSADAADSADVVGTDARPPVPRRSAGIVAVVALAVVALVVTHQGGSPPSGTATPSPTASAVVPGPEPVTPPPALVLDSHHRHPRVTNVGAHVLGVHAGWDLLGWGDSRVVRLEPASGRLTVTPVPPLDSTGPVSFAAGPDRVVIRPLDDVAGYSVVDGRIARPLTGFLAGGGLMVPGPSPGLVWRETDDPIPSMVLTGLNGVQTGVRAIVPSNPFGPLVSDGSGYLLYVAPGGAYDIRPGVIDRLTVGSVVAAGAGRVLAIECADENRCSTVVLNRVTGSRRVIGSGFSPPHYIGPISPDGRRAAILFQGIGDRPLLELVDLRSGHVTMVGLDIGLPSPLSGLVWSPDSRILFALDEQGLVHVVNPATGTEKVLPVDLPPLSEIAIRPAPR